MTDTTTAGPPAPEVKDQAARALDMIKNIPARRWFLIRKRLDMTEDEIFDSMAAIAVVAANEAYRGEQAEQGTPAPRDDYERFLSMGLFELMEYTGITTTDDNPDDAAAGDTKSDDAERG